MKKSLFIIPLMLLTLSACSLNSENTHVEDDNNQQENDNNNVSETPDNGSENNNNNNEDQGSNEVKTFNPLDEPYIGRQYYLNHIGDIYSAWKSYTGKGVTIAVIDVGFKPSLLLS